MRANFSKVFFLMLLTLLALKAGALVSEYTFSGTMGTYTQITGGTVLGSTINDDESFNAIPLGFTMLFNGVQYSEISIQTDAFLAFGPTVLNSTLAISSATGTNNIVSALNRDLLSRADGELSYLLTGTAPNRVFTIQWKNYRRVPTAAANDIINFQIKLSETSNTVVFVYGAFTLTTISTAQTVQVGLRGSSNTDFLNRTTTTDWTATLPGTAANANCTINATVFPANGLTFTFSPSGGDVPPASQFLYPTNTAVNVNPATNLGWTSGGAPTGYRVYFGTDNPPTNLVNGTVQTATVYDPPVNLNFSTQYFWKIVPFNNFGDAVGCMVWSFTTMPDPTITTYPYIQNFDTVTPPGIPLGWTTLNLNADAYTWSSVADAIANSAPNAMRMRYNETVAMNDWLISPPLQLTGGGLYRISFYYRSGGTGFTERLALYMGSEPTAEALTTQLFINNAITTTTYQLVEIDIPITANSIKYLGFKGFSEMNMLYLYLDSFSITEIGPIFDINPASHAFGSVNVGESANQSFTIMNFGGGSLVINNIAIAGSPMLSLSNLPTLPVTLGWGATSTFSVVFAPTAAGEQTATVTVSDNLTRIDHTIAITGTGFLNEVFNPPVNLAANVTGNDVHLTWTAPVARVSSGTGVPANFGNSLTRNLLGYKVYRDGVLLSTISNPATLSYDDMDLDEGVYAYAVTAYYTSGESVPAGPLNVTILEQLLSPINLEGHVQSNDVTLNWTSPIPTIEGDWLTWSNDVIGNTVGTNEAVQFIVAQRWDQADLAAYQGGTVTRLKFVPAYENCIYTAKVWTGGSSADPGTLVSSQVVSNVVLDEWNLVNLSEAISIPTAGDLWVGYAVNTQGGYPASVDYGPAVEGKGNMMFFNGEWTTLSQLSSTMVYNWLIEAFVAEGVGMKNVAPRAIAEPRQTGQNSGTLALNPAPAVHTRDLSRALTGFKVYRDGALIANLNNPSAVSYMDMNRDNGDYVYWVSAVYSGGESAPAEVNVNVNMQMAPVVFSSGFDDYEDFAAEFAPWTLLDIDQSETYGFNDVDFPGNETALAYMVFNPTATTPPLQNLSAYDGAKMLACFASVTPPNNDWVITPRINLGTGSKLRFYAKSHTAQYGLERFRIGVSTLATIIPEGFQYITGINAVEAPLAWTEYTYDLAGFDNQPVYIGIRCVSNDAFVFYVDKFSVHSVGGSVTGDDPTLPLNVTELRGNYPNPFQPATTIMYKVKDRSPVAIEIFNVKGQLVRSLVNDLKATGEYSVVWDGTDYQGHHLSNGVYFYRMQAGTYQSTRKMILLK